MLRPSHKANKQSATLVFGQALRHEEIKEIGALGHDLRQSFFFVPLSLGGENLYR